MKVIVGLGNPGSDYVRTRHNVGFQVGELLSRRWSIRLDSEACSARFGEGNWKGEKVRLVLPQTFMNASGAAVAPLMKRWKQEAGNLLLVCDDLALPLGRVRLRGQGSDGGHLGLASVFEQMGTRQIARLRVGIAAVGTGRVRGDLTPRVLGRFEASEKEPLEAGLKQAVEACESWVVDGLATAMNRFNRKTT